VQGNLDRTVVRFGVNSRFRILPLDAGLNIRRLTARLEHPSGHTSFTVLCSENPTAPANTWTHATSASASAADEPNQIRRLEVNLPASILGRCCLTG
jgi:hypothetical protein